MEKIDRLQFLNESNNRLVQVGEDILSIKELKPYDSWDNFKSEILKNLKIYWKIANPNGINRIGLRYINKIYPLMSLDVQIMYNNQLYLDF